MQAMGARKTKPHKPADVGESGNVLKDGPDRPIGKEFPESVVSDHFPQPEEEATLFTTDHLHEGVVGRRLHDETLQPALVVDSGTDRGVCLPLPNTASRLIRWRRGQKEVWTHLTTCFCVQAERTCKCR